LDELQASIYTVSKKLPLSYCPYLSQALTDLQNSFTGTFCWTVCNKVIDYLSVVVLLVDPLRIVWLVGWNVNCRIRINCPSNNWYGAFEPWPMRVLIRLNSGLPVPDLLPQAVWPRPHRVVSYL